MCVHTIDEFLEEFPSFCRKEVDQAAAQLRGAFPDIPQDRLGEAVLLCFVGEDPDTWLTFAQDVEHYWELFVQRSSKKVLECPHETAEETQKWLLKELDSLSLMLWEATRRGIGRQQADRMMAEACNIAFVSCNMALAMALDDTIN